MLLLYPRQVFDNKFWIGYRFSITLVGTARIIQASDSLSWDAFVPYFVLCFIPSIALYFQEKHLKLRLSEVGFGKMLFRFLLGVCFYHGGFPLFGSSFARGVEGNFHDDPEVILVPFRSYCLFLFGYYFVSVFNQVYVLYFKSAEDRCGEASCIAAHQAGIKTFSQGDMSGQRNGNFSGPETRPSESKRFLLTMSPLVQLDNVSREYRNGMVKALRDVSMTVKTGEATAINRTQRQWQVDASSDPWSDGRPDGGRYQV